MATYDFIGSAQVDTRVSPYPRIPDEVYNDILPILLIAAPVGSRVTCNPAPVGTDEDYLVLVSGNPEQVMSAAGYTQDGSPEFYTGNDNGGFRSWRKGDVNIITTESSQFYDKFILATELCKRLNLLQKIERIMVFQAILYGVPPHNIGA